MGGTTSQLPPTDNDLPLLALTFDSANKIKLINANAVALNAVRRSIAECWPKGLHYERLKCGETVLKLRGVPFGKSSRPDPISMRRLLCRLIESLSSSYHLMASTDVIQTVDQSTWFFQRNIDDASNKKMLANIIALAIGSAHYLMLVNAPELMNRELRDAVAPQVHEWYTVGGAFTVRIRGKPWQNKSFAKGVTARRILLRIFSRFDEKGYRFLGRCNAQGTADTLFFINDQQEHCSSTTSSTYACLSLNSSDCFRLINFNERQIDVGQTCNKRDAGTERQKTNGTYDTQPTVAKRIINTTNHAYAHRNVIERNTKQVRQAISSQWPCGLQADVVDGLSHVDVHEFKLRGSPWSPTDYEEAMLCRRLIVVIMQGLLAEGLEVTAGLGISVNVNDKGIFILRSCEPVKQVLKHIALAPMSSDMLALVHMSRSEVNSVRQAIARHYTLGVQSEMQTFLPHSGALFSTTFKLRGEPWGDPWGRNGNENALARLTLCYVLHCLLRCGYRCVCAADLSGDYSTDGEGGDYPMSVDTLFFVKRIKQRLAPIVPIDYQYL